MKPSQAEIRILKAYASQLPPVFIIIKPKTGAKESVEQVDHFKTMLGYLVKGQKDKITKYIEGASSVNAAHEQMVQGMEQRRNSLI